MCFESFFYTHPGMEIFDGWGWGVSAEVARGDFFLVRGPRSGRYFYGYMCG